MINKCNQCSVKIFMACLFENDKSGLEGGDFETIFTEYIDLSGIGETREFDLLTGIHNIQARMTFIETMLEVQKRFFKEFEMPFVNAFDDFRPFGHRLSWDPEKPELFIEQLKRIETIEKKSQAELDAKFKELNSLKKNGMKSTDVNGRVDFVRQLNNLNKAGYKIDREKTDMEELALMIRDYNEMVRDQLAEIAKHKNSF